MEFDYGILDRSFREKKKCVKIGYSLMKKNGIKAGDCILLSHGEYKTPAIVIPQDDYIPSIGIDLATKLSLRLDVNDKIRIEKTKVLSSKRGEIVLIPYDSTISPASFPMVIRHIRSAFKYSPFSVNDIIPITINNEMHKFLVRSVSYNVIKITDDVDIRIIRADLLGRVPDLNLENIGGLRSVKQAVQMRIILPLEHPEIFAKFSKNIKPPKGILFHGPPGTGKTLLMRAIAGHLKKCETIEISAAEVFRKYYGEGEKRIEQIFETAKKNAPSIIFIDEFDAIASERKNASGDLERRIVAKFLSEMDGLKSNENVIVIASTNLPDRIDEAFRRTGRFDYEIEFFPPDVDERLEILKIHTSHLPMESDVNLETIAKKTHGYVGADLYGLVSEAVIQCIRRYLPNFDLSKKIPESELSKMKVSMNDFNEAMKIVRPSAMRDVISTSLDRIDPIIGMEKYKRILWESIVWKISPPEKLKNIDIDLPKNVFLYGPPGCGKTTLVKKIAKESGFNFIYVRSPEVMTKWVGESAKNVKRIFDKARRLQPSIVFIDEIDAISLNRGKIGNEAALQVIAQLLIELDAAKNDAISVIAATNMPRFVDPALIRSGRFDLHLYIPPPSDSEREAIFKALLENLPLGNINWEEVVKKSKGFTPADIKTAIGFAVSEFVHSDSDKITHPHLITGIGMVKPSASKDLLSEYESFGLRSSASFRSGLYS